MSVQPHGPGLEPRESQAVYLRPLTREERELRFADLGFISIRGRVSSAGVLLPSPGHEFSGDWDLTSETCTNRSCGSARRYRTGEGLLYACACICHTKPLEALS